MIIQYQVSFTEAIGRAFSNYANFSGRASRSEYWWFALFTGAVNVFFNILSSVAQAMTPHEEFNAFYIVILVIQMIWGLIIFLPSLSLFVRRMHDIDKSGWNYFWVFLCCIGSILLLVWCCKDSDMHENQYGPVPNAIDDDVNYNNYDGSNYGVY